MFKQPSNAHNADQGQKAPNSPAPHELLIAMTELNQNSNNRLISVMLAVQCCA
jgi:hypothetical protein